MKRHVALQRTGRLRPVSRRARIIVEPRWRKVKAQVRHRSGGQCEVILASRCPQAAVDCHHTLKRHHGRSLTDRAELCIDICQLHHRQTDWPFALGRLVINPIGDGRFISRIVTKASKWAS
jgi:hypothetical protein